MTTSAPNELYLVLEAFKSALKSIDLRCIAVSPPSKEYWQNLVTSIFLSDKTVGEVKAEQKTIPSIRNNFFALFFDAVPFNYYVSTRIAEGELRIPVAPFGRNRIQFRKSDLLALKVMSSKEWIDGSPTWMLKTTDLGLEEERKELWSIVDNKACMQKRLKSNPQT